jgi:chromate transporter
MRELAVLFLVFARVGVTTFGGGYAILPVLRREVVVRRPWATDAQILDYYAIGQCTPGVIAVNASTFVGYGRAGVPGALAATLGLVTPSVVIITAIAAVLSNFAQIEAVRHAFAGIRVCVCVLIGGTVADMWKKSVPDRPALAIFSAVFLLSVIFSLPSAALVIGAGAAGMSLAAVRRGRER